MYFAGRAAYCNETFAFAAGGTPCRKQLIYARVLVGRPQQFGMVTDDRLTKPEQGYHSVAGGPHKFSDDGEESSMWVVYDNAQVYPQYIVEYVEAGE